MLPSQPHKPMLFRFQNIVSWCQNYMPINLNAGKVLIKLSAQDIIFIDFTFIPKTLIKSMCKACSPCMHLLFFARNTFINGVSPTEI